MTVRPSPPVRLVATDLDGTFLDADGQVSDLNAKAVHAAAERGVRMVFATGRPARWLDVLEPLVPVHPYVIASNGAVHYDIFTERVTTAHQVPTADTAAVVEDLERALPGLLFALEYVDGWGRLSGFPLQGDFAEATVEADDMGELLRAGQAIKLLVLSLGTETVTLMRLVEPIVAGRLDVTFSFVRDSGLLELSAPGVSKGSALRDLMAELGLEASQLAAFGDMPNDLSMLELAGHPFAMDNAHPLLLERGFGRARPHHDSGVGHAMLELLGLPD
ncbi:MAG: HAD family hydrolase [Propionibacteriaceae bacterium]|jgi:Cof subfamily protein (haloacid dehalogenase superfamily)|nr:HAD family hydrolase [Propionibacteriaceae bacterium]